MKHRSRSCEITHAIIPANSKPVDTIAPQHSLAPARALNPQTAPTHPFRPEYAGAKPKNAYFSIIYTKIVYFVSYSELIRHGRHTKQTAESKDARFCVSTILVYQRYFARCTNLLNHANNSRQNGRAIWD
jgi:hypothetical protein